MFGSNHLKRAQRVWRNPWSERDSVMRGGGGAPFIGPPSSARLALLLTRGLNQNSHDTRWKFTFSAKVSCLSSGVNLGTLFERQHQKCFGTKNTELFHLPACSASVYETTKPRQPSNAKGQRECCLFFFLPQDFVFHENISLPLRLPGSHVTATSVLVCCVLGCEFRKRFEVQGPLFWAGSEISQKIRPGVLSVIQTVNPVTCPVCFCTKCEIVPPPHLARCWSLLSISHCCVGNIKNSFDPPSLLQPFCSRCASSAPTCCLRLERVVIPQPLRTVLAGKSLHTRALPKWNWVAFAGWKVCMPTNQTESTFCGLQLLSLHLQPGKWVDLTPYNHRD